MRIALVSASPEVDLGRISELMAELGLEALPIQKSGITAFEVPEGAERCFLISPEPGILALGELVTRFRAVLPDAVPLQVCAPRSTAPDRQVLLECGASQVLTPGSWRARQVAERILAHLILERSVEPSAFGVLLGATAPMREVYQAIERVAPLDEPVLVLGETGTGKELVAQEIHRRSPRSEDLLALNCAALTPALVESELFGHQRGAFSGAEGTRQGLLIAAGKGTVFLDEIGDLAAESQAKLLRVLEERTLRPVGSNRWQPVEARVVLATHQDLEKAVTERRFREDLYHRIHGFTVRLPPLRERKADLLLLADHFLAEYNQRYPGERVVPPGAFDPLFRYHWPGNVRELRQAIWHAATFSTGNGGPIGALALQEWTAQKPREKQPRWQLAFDPEMDTWRDVQERLRAAYFRAVLRETGGNKELAARRAGVSRSQLYEILRQIEENPDEGQTDP